MKPDGSVEEDLQDIVKGLVPGDRIEIYVTPASDYETPVVKNLKIKVCEKFPGNM